MTGTTYKGEPEVNIPEPDRGSYVAHLRNGTYIRETRREVVRV